MWKRTRGGCVWRVRNGDKFRLIQTSEKGVFQIVIRCRHCGEEVEEGREFCAHCGQNLAAAGEIVSTASQPPASANLMSSFDRSKDEGDKTRRMIYIAVALASALLIAGGVWLISRPKAQTADEQLAGASRAGTPEFEQYRKLIDVDFDPDEDASIGERALGDLQVSMNPTVRNFTGKTVSGLEFHAAGYDLDKRTIRERTFVKQLDLETNRVSKLSIPITFPKDNRPASLKLELTGFTFK